MKTLDEILEATCEAVGIDKDKIADKRKIDESHQIARIVYCHIANITYGFGYRAIGAKINRAPTNVYHNVNKAPINSYRFFDFIIKEVQLKLSNGQT